MGLSVACKVELVGNMTSPCSKLIVLCLSRYLMGQKEYEVELQFTSGMVSYPIRTKTGEDFVDGEQPVYGSTTDIGSIAASRVSMPNSRANSFFSVKSGAAGAKAGGGPIKLTVDPPKRKVSFHIMEYFRASS